MSKDNEASILWLIVASISIILHVVGIFSLCSLRRRKVSDYLLILLSIVEILKITMRVVFTILCMRTGACRRTNVLITTVAICLIGQYQSVILITVDRVLKVKLSMKYNALVTRNIIFRLLIPYVSICLVHGSITWIFPHLEIKILLAWEILVFAIIIISYLYMFLHLKISARRLSRRSASTIRRQTLNLKVPILISVRFIAFYFTPNLLLAVKLIKFSPWLYSIYDLNIATDAIIYVLGTPKIRECLCPSRVRKSSSISTITIK